MDKTLYAYRDGSAARFREDDDDDDNFTLKEPRLKGSSAGSTKGPTASTSSSGASVVVTGRPIDSHGREMIIPQQLSSNGSNDFDRETRKPVFIASDQYLEPTPRVESEPSTNFMPPTTTKRAGRAPPRADEHGHARRPHDVLPWAVAQGGIGQDVNSNSSGSRSRSDEIDYIGKAPPKQGSKRKSTGKSGVKRKSSKQKGKRRGSKEVQNSSSGYRTRSASDRASGKSSRMMRLSYGPAGIDGGAF